MNKYENKDGQLSAYALSCGCMQEVKTNTLHIILFQDGDYQIEAYDIKNPYSKVFRKSFARLSNARKEFKKLKRK